MPARVYLVRHGESGWNRDRRIQGQAAEAPGLTGDGWRQAGALAVELERELSGARAYLVHSDLLRAAQTARVLLSQVGRDLGPDPRFRELHYGRLEGLLRDEPWEDATAGDRADAVWTAADGHAPGGESVAELTRRVVDGLMDHRAGLADDEVLVVAAHGGVLRAAQRLATTSGAVQLRIPNASVFRLPTESLPVPIP